MFFSIWVLRIILCVFVSMGSDVFCMFLSLMSSEDCFACFCLYGF